VSGIPAIALPALRAQQGGFSPEESGPTLCSQIVEADPAPALQGGQEKTIKAGPFPDRFQIPNCRP
jgi:hypothetical protein